jgi:hypothetical protein
MQKDGTYRVVYGSALKDVTGRVKMVVVGYGRESTLSVGLSLSKLQPTRLVRPIVVATGFKS